MAKLNQVLAVVKGAQADAEKARTNAYQALQKEKALSGLLRTYKAKDDEDNTRLPEEKTNVQLTVPKALAYAFGPWERVMNVVFERDKTNCEAVADLVTADGTTIAVGVPTTYLLWLEKELHHLHTLIAKLPRLDPSQKWEYDPNRGHYVAEPVETERSVKVPKAFVKYEATDKHPAQVETFTEAKVVGYWTKLDFSGAIPADEAEALLARVRDLQDAVRFAIEQANSVEVKTRADIGANVLGYVMAAATTPGA